MLLYDLITIGRSGVDVYPLQTGVGLADVETFGKFLGGSPTNVAVAAARHGLRSAVVTGVGADPFGDYVRRAIRGFGVDDAFVRTIEGRPTPVTFCEIFPPTTSRSTSTAASDRPTCSSPRPCSTWRRSPGRGCSGSR
ncbi:PfkB family carbohydrate kinase [Nonomuraea rubra]|uniref:PfkB family carbohydrate kinase n=1 Tax=Nonomuraea rubra TaxID=46180 RepID=UPI0036140AEC